MLSQVPFNADLGASEVVCSAGPGCGGCGEAGIYKVESNSADLGVGLVQGVLAGACSVVGVWITFKIKFLCFIKFF